MKRTLIACACLLALGAVASAQTTRGLRVEDFARLRDAGDPQISPDGVVVAYTITSTNLDENKRNTQIWVVPAAGGAPRQLTTPPGNNSRPRWSPDGKQIAFLSTRDGESQIWIMNADGGGARKVTTIATEAGDHVWSRDGASLLFASDIYPECPDEACNKRRLEAAAASKVKAKTADRLLFRHWTTWKEGKRSHVFVVPVAGGPARDLTPGDYDAPPFSLGGPDNYTFSPDGKEVAFARNTDKVEATSTNNDLFVVPVGGGEAKRITMGQGSDIGPVYSPDGRYIAYRSLERPGFEADLTRLMLYDRQSGASRSLSGTLDRPVDAVVWAPDSKKIYITAEDASYSPIFSVDVDSGKITRLVEKSSNHDLGLSGDGRTFVFSRSSEAMPSEIFRASADGTGVVRLTETNAEALSGVQPSAAEDLWSKGAAGAKVHSLLFKPAGFDPSKKYPMVVLIHGGPQGAWGRSFSYRWNPNIYAGAGYVVLLPNPRGSTGYGQKFTDEISGDWGGKAYEDIMGAVDEATKLPYVDKNRMAAAGASYGGYMVNWIAGHTDRFKALVSHAGLFNLESMYGATEELWFTNWEFKGTPWDNPKMYEKHSPSKFVKNFKTPTLVIHGELDYRVPVGEGLQMFTALQLRNVPSRLVYFPDEGHWILKPQNRVMWYGEVLGWLDKYLKQ